MLKGKTKTEYQRGYMRKWRKLQSLKRQFGKRVKLKYLKEIAGMSCLLLFGGCDSRNQQEKVLTEYAEYGFKCGTNGISWEVLHTNLQTAFEYARWVNGEIKRPVLVLRGYDK